MPPVWGIHDDDLAAAGADGLRLPGELLLGDMLEPHVQRQVQVRSARPPRLRVRGRAPRSGRARSRILVARSGCPRQDAVVLVLQPSQALLVDAGVADRGTRRYPSRIHAAHLLPDVDARGAPWLPAPPPLRATPGAPARRRGHRKRGRRSRRLREREGKTVAIFCAVTSGLSHVARCRRRRRGPGCWRARTLSRRSKMRPRSGDTVNHAWFCCAAESRQKAYWPTCTTDSRTSIARKARPNVPTTRNSRWRL